MDGDGFLMPLHKHVNSLLVDKLVILLVFRGKPDKTL